MGGGSWDSEITWEILDANGVVSCNWSCWDDTCHRYHARWLNTLMAYDSYGDGWNGATLQFLMQK